VHSIELFNESVFPEPVLSKREHRIPTVSDASRFPTSSSISTQRRDIMIHDPCSGHLDWSLRIQRWMFGMLAMAFATIAFTPILFGGTAAAQAPLKILFLGDQGHHRPADLYRVLEPALKGYGIEVTYTEDVVGSLTAAGLDAFDGLLVYANIDELGKPQEAALLEYVRSGKGFIPLHCATYCFRNSSAYIELVGAQFKEHGGQRFSTQIVEPTHPIMQGFDGFESWDETYVHHKHNTKDRVVLEERRQGQLAPNTDAEPWTWVRTHGEGRVFYTAWGHNMDTWGNRGFQNLVARGIHWACKRDLSALPAYTDPTRFDLPKMTAARTDVAPFTFTDVGSEIPNYRPGGKRGGQDDPMSQMQAPLSASESEKHYVTPEGFKVQLWASEKETLEGEAERGMAGLAGKPIAMNWDHRGRLWVCETVDYPNELQPAGKGRDRIRICEDTDGDGKADKFTVFASNMSIPTAIVCYRDGVIVQDGVKTIYLKDTTGDDVADMKQELITGWSMGDTHGGVSNFQYGLDNWIWAMQGYNDSNPVINGQKQQGFRQGFWRFALESAASNETAPVFAIGADGRAESKRSAQFDTHSIRVSKLEFVRSTNNNTWGFGVSEEGLIFGSTANGNPSIFMPVANNYYERVSGWSPKVLSNIAENDRFSAVTKNVRQVDFHGGYTAAAGHALYTARNYPKQWWNRLAFVCEPTGHLIGGFVLNQDGAGYRSSNPFNLVASDDEWSSPIMAEVGPDGNVWFLDWYNFIVQHNPTPHGFETGKGNAYETKLRDKRYGRVYRVVYNGKDGLSEEALKQADGLVQGGLTAANEAGLVAALRHPNMFWRRAAQRLLIEKQRLDDKTSAALKGLVRDQSVDSVGLNVGAIHAIWVLSSRGEWSAELADAAMRHPSRGVQRNAVSAATPDAATAKSIVANKLLVSEDAQVRLASLLKLADCPAGTPGIAEALLMSGIGDVVPGTSDHWLLDAWTSAASVHADQVLPKLVRDAEMKVSSELASRIAIVAEHAARNRIDAVTMAQLVVPKGNTAVTTSIIGGLIQGWPRDYRLELPESTSDAFVSSWISGELPLEVKGQVIQLAGSLGIQKLEAAISGVRSQLLERLEKSGLADGQRIEAAKQMVVLEPGSESVVTALLDQVTPQSTPELSAGVVSALASSKVNGLVDKLLERAQSLPPEFLRNSIRMMLSRPETTVVLIDAIGAGKLSINDLQLDQRQLLRDHPDAKIREKALAMMKSSGGIPNADRQKLVESWMAITEESGDAANGKVLYQKHCALCHKHGDLGNVIGPDLTGMAVHPKAELLVNILDPNRSVEGNFRTYNVQTTDGVVVTGMLAGETKTSIEIVNVQGKREVVLREDIDRMSGSQKSLMPEGFESQMTREEMKDLLEFLTSKGKYVPLSIASIATSITTRGMFFEPDGQIERLVFPDWSPKVFKGVPFVLVDPQGDRVPNAVMLYGPNGKMAPKMPKSVEVVCNSPAVAIHFLSGVGGWSFPATREGSTSMIVQITYADDTTEDHDMVNGQHFADYIGRVDVPKSEYAFDLRGRQMRYFSVKPRENKPLKKISLIKGRDASAPIVMAMTLQTSE
jgi:uncharacterized protein